MPQLWKHISYLILLTISLWVQPLWAEVITAENCPKKAVFTNDSKPQIVDFDISYDKTLLAFLRKLEDYHYSKKKIDDQFSAQFFQQYLKYIDPNKAFLNKTDIDRLEASYEIKLDDYLQQTHSLPLLSPLIDIYTLFRQRAIERLNDNIKQLKSADSTFRFDSNDSLTLDQDHYSYRNEDELDHYWSKRITLALLNLILIGDSEQDARFKVIRRYQNQLGYLKQEKPIQIFDTYLNALASIYDPHTNYLSPQDSKNFEINMSLSLEGIGAVLRQRDEFTQIVRIIPGGPADKEGTLATSDRIVGVAEGKHCPMLDVVGWRLSEVVKHIRGVKGSTVRLKIIPAEYSDLSEERQIVTIVREKVKLDDNAAKSEVIELSNKKTEIVRLGVIDLPSFYIDNTARQLGDSNFRSTTRDVKELIDKLNQSSIDGLIIDLRENGGGSLTEAISLTGLFIGRKPVVQVKNAYQHTIGNLWSTESIYFDKPLVVLIDRLSASASEIFAVAIQDYGRGLIIGGSTFGKGTVQAIRSLPSGQAKITESKFYRISGHSTQL